MKASERRRIRRRIEMEGGKCPKCRARGAVQLRGEQVVCVVCGAIRAPEQGDERPRMMAGLWPKPEGEATHCLADDPDPTEQGDDR